MTQTLLQEYQSLKNELIQLNAEAQTTLSTACGFTRLISLGYSFHHKSKVYFSLSHAETMLHKLEYKYVEIYYKSKELGNKLPQEENDFLEKQLNFTFSFSNKFYQCRAMPGLFELTSINTATTEEAANLALKNAIKDICEKMPSFLYRRNQTGGFKYLEFINDELYINISYLFYESVSDAKSSSLIDELFESLITIIEAGAKGNSNLSNYGLVLDRSFDGIIEKINDKLNLNISQCFHDWIQRDQNLEELSHLWQQVLQLDDDVFRTETGVYIPNESILPIYKDEILPSYLKKIEDKFNSGELISSDEEDDDGYIEPKADNKTSSAIMKIFDSNSILINKLKESGLQISASALQNDQNIARVANTVYNLLPNMVRLFVTYETVENFLLEHRQWLINKLI